MRKFFEKIPLWCIVLVLAAIFIVLGLMQGGFQDTLRKAALICYECIGIG